MKKETVVLSLLAMGAFTIASVNFVVHNSDADPQPAAKGQEPARVQTPTRDVERDRVRDERRIAELTNLAKKEFWTGRKRYRTPAGMADKQPLPIYEHEDTKVEGLPAKINVPEGTKFRVDGWSDIREGPKRLFVQFENGKTGWMATDYTLDHGSALAQPPYDNARGIDDQNTQSYYDVPFKEAISQQALGVKAREREKVVAATERAATAARDRKERAEIVRAAKQRGVEIGMSKADAIASSWGKPQNVNRTTTAHGVREQWVYDGGYLYFDNGVLTAIQN